MIRILLTGTNGQVGSALREPLASIGSVLATDRTVLDLSRPDTVAPILDRLSPDLIINPAAYTAVDQAEDNRELAYRVNAEAPRAIARWAAENDVPMVHFSTDYVFDGSQDRPLREDDPTGPLSVYGASKLAGEIAIQEAGGSHLIIRTSWVYAPKGRNFFTTIVRLARERKELRIVADQIGAPTSARSIAHGLMSILGDRGTNFIKPRFAETNGVVHMSNSGQTSWCGFATAIVEGIRDRGQQLSVETITSIGTKDFPTKATRPLNSCFDMRRLTKVFGIQMPTWPEALNAGLDELATSPR
jgi:dTDP-4-dehydrorhamnose reductase